MALDVLAQRGTVSAIVTSILVIFAIRKFVVFSKLRHFGGPFATGFTNFFHRKAIFGPACHEWYEEVNDQYGSIARVAPNVLITSSPDVWTHVNIKPGYKRSDWYYHAVRIEYRRDNVFTQTDNLKHDRRRKQMAPGYSGRENLDLEPAIDTRVQSFLSLIRSKYISTEERVVPMDCAKVVQYFTLDVISLVGLGKTFGMLESDEDVDDYLKSSEEGLRTAAVALSLGVSWLAQSPWLGRLIAPSPKDSNGFGKMMATCFRYVDERSANETDIKSDMLASFIRHGLRGDELRSEALEQIVAGSDTTAASIRGIILYVITNPRVYRKLQREVDESVLRGHVSRARDTIVSITQAKQLPYLQAVVREGLRVWPPVVNVFARDVPQGGDTVLLDGKPVFLPSGTSIGYSGWAMHHSAVIYGEDAKSFRPERWFEKDLDKLDMMTRTNDLVFGYGKFQCLGKPVAHIEINKIIFELLRNFEMALLNPSTPWKTRNNIGLFAISDMWVQVTERSPAQT